VTTTSACAAARGRLYRFLAAAFLTPPTAEMVAPMLQVLEKGPDEMRVQAAEHLISIGDKRCVEPLIAALKDSKSSAELRRRAGQALGAITGQNYGDNAGNWEGWWASNKDKEIQGPSGSDSGGGGTVALDRGRGSEWEDLKKSAKVLVLGAGKKCKCGHDHDLDHIERVCSQLGLEAVFVDKVAFEKDECKPEEYIAILANCTHIREHCACPQCKPGNYRGDRLFNCECPINKHEPVQYLLGEPGVRKIKKYVEKGGYVFAEDWCMEDFVERAFGEFVRHGSIRGADEEVPVLAAPGVMSHTYLKKIFYKGYKPKEGKGTVSEEELKEVVHTWKIDKETRTIKIVDPNKVVTLLTSPELEKYAQGDDAVAVTFVVAGRPGTATGGMQEIPSGGRVLYVLSHFGKQKSSEDEYSLQNLMINFLVEAYARRRR